MAAAFPARASEQLILAKLVELADQHQGFVAILTPSITRHCMHAVWGQNPPKLFREWAETLLLDDLSNRALVQRGDLAKHEAVASRRLLFHSLEQIEPEAMKAIQIYTSVRPYGVFSRDVTRVMDCQYRGVAAALHGTDES